jgi:hypothetical protein
MASRVGPPDFVLVTGDIAFSAQPTQYATAKAWLGRFCAAAGVSTRALAIVPGNHDVDRAEVKKSPLRRMLHERLATSAGTRDLDELLVSDDAKELTAKLETYAAFAAGCGSPFARAGAPWVDAPGRHEPRTCPPGRPQHRAREP